MAIRGRWVTAAALVAAALAIGGCSGSGDGDVASAQRDFLEQEIKPELSQQLSERAEARIRVDQLTCTNTGEGRFECLAEASGGDGEGGRETAAVSIVATCDEVNCIWRVQEP